MSLIEHILSVIAPHECLGCQKEGFVLCNDCIERLPRPAAGVPPEGLASLQAVTLYDAELAKELVHRLKFERARAAANSIACAMQTRLAVPASDNLVLAWVPTATSRVRARGYDQSQQIACALSRRLGLPAAPLLARTGQQRQVGSDRTHRLEQLHSAFRVTKPWLIQNKDVLLLDDVSTTGATLAVVAHELHAAGARSVHAFVFAQA